MRTSNLVVSLALVLSSGIACKEKELTRAEAQQALEESKVSTEVANLTSGTLEISTNFTIGQAVQAAAEELRQFYLAELPCAEVTLENATLTIEYGVNGTCLYRGQTYEGRHSVTISRNDADDVVVDHVWEDLTNQRLRVNGTASVTYSLDEPSRHVVHDLRWERLSDGAEWQGSGDRVQRPLAAGIGTGFSVEGTRTWQSSRGTWDLSINQVEMRWIDPVPQAGSYALDTPFDKQMSMSFQRQNETTILVTVASGNKSFDFEVTTEADAAAE